MDRCHRHESYLVDRAKSIIDMRSKKAIREGNYDDDMMTRTHTTDDAMVLREGRVALKRDLSPP